MDSDRAGPSTWLAGRRSIASALALALAAQIGLALTPYLVDRVPVALLLLRPQLELVLLVAGNLDPLVVIAVVAPLRWLTHFTYTEVGRYVGPIVLMRTRTGRLITKRLELRWTRRALLVTCLVHLGTPVDLALGASGAPRRHVGWVIAAGAVVTTTMYTLVGKALAPTTAHVIAWVIEHRPLATVVLALAGSIGWLVGRRSLSTRSGPGPGQVEE